MNKCVVKLNQPHIHRANGPMFKIGKRIVEELNLKAMTYNRKIITAKTTSSTSETVRSKRRRPQYSDVEPSDSELESFSSKSKQKRRRVEDKLPFPSSAKSTHSSVDET